MPTDCSRSSAFLEFAFPAPHHIPEVNLRATSLCHRGFLGFPWVCSSLAAAQIPDWDAWQGLDTKHSQLPQTTFHGTLHLPFPSSTPKNPALSPATPSPSTAISQVPRLNCRGCRHIYYLFLPCHLAFVYQKKIISVSNRGKNISPCNSCRSKGEKKNTFKKKIKSCGPYGRFFFS